MRKIKVAIIGAGQIAQTTHIPAFKSMENVEIVGVSDTYENVAGKVAKDFDIPFSCSSHLELLEKCNPDAVSVCVPNKFHYPIVMDALDRGCHVMCEKPPAISYSQAKEMADKAKSKGLILTYDFHFRHGTNVAILKDLIENGKMGQIYYTKVQWLRKAGVPGWGNFLSKDMQGGGPLIDIGAHMLDIALYLLDYKKVSYVSAISSNLIGTKQSNGLMGSWNPEKYTVEDGLFGNIVFEDGTGIGIETTFALNMKEKDVRAVKVYGDELGASLFPLEIYSGSNRNYQAVNYPYISDGDLHNKALENFIDAIEGKEEVLVKAGEGAYIQMIIEALYKSAEKKEPVFL